MTRGRPARRGVRSAVLAVTAVLTSACDRSVAGEATPAAQPSLPAGPAQLEELLVETVPSGLPRLPDASVRPTAGEKTLEDMAAYADDPERERRVLEDYGYRYGWERFWGVRDGAMTSVFLHLLGSRAGAARYARDLAANDAAHYDGILADDPPGLPRGCWLLVVEHPRPRSGLDGPAAITWCGRGTFSVSVTAVADSVEAARQEVHELLPEQLDRLPPR